MVLYLYQQISVSCHHLYTFRQIIYIYLIILLLVL